MSIFKDILNVLRREAAPLVPVPEGQNQYGLSVSSSVVTLKVPPDAVYGEIYVRTSSIVFTRAASGPFTKSRSNPTATQGLEAFPDDLIVLDAHAKLVGFRAIRGGSADATIDVEYFRKAVS